jgi:hypothetical protein
MRIPKGIKTSEPIEGLGQLDKAPFEPSCCKCKCNCHQHHHCNSRLRFYPFDQPHVAGFIFPEVMLAKYCPIFFLRQVGKPRKIAGKVASGMENDTNNNSYSRGLHSIAVSLHKEK